MALSVLSNFAANVAHRNLSTNDAMVTSSLAKLSSGSRVVSAKDDAAALAIGSRLTAEVAGLKQASVNAGQAVSMLQIADGALGKVSDILVRMKSLSVQAGSDQLSSTERGFLNTEYTQLRSEIDRIAADTEFNGNKLLNGSSTVAVSAVGTDIEVADGIVGLSFGGSHNVSTAGDTYTIAYDTGTDRFTVSQGSTTALSEVVAAAPTAGTTQDIYISEFDLTISVGSNFAPTTAITANNTFTATSSSANTVSFGFKIGTGNVAAEDEIAITLSQATSTALGSATGTAFATGDVTTKGNADQASSDVGSVINKVNEYRATIGANQNRLEFAAANLATVTENTESARSALTDLDVAAEMTNFTSKQILMQAGVSMLAQANQLPGNLLRLFQ